MKTRFISGLLLLAYMALLIKVMVFKDIPTISIGYLKLNFGGTQGGSPNLIPFKTILPYLMGKNGLLIGGINILGNIVLLIPIGFLLPMVFQRMSWWMVVFISIASGMFIELTQVYLKVGIFDIDDVILNAVGVILGYQCYLMMPLLWKKFQKHKFIYSSIIVIMIAAIYLGATYYLQHQPKPPMMQGPGMGMTQKENRSDSFQLPDPCGGTGGTGQIMKIQTNGFSIRRKDGLVQEIRLSGQTQIKNAQGPITAATLKMGDHVTIVVETDNPDGSLNAILVLVCNMN